MSVSARAGLLLLLGCLASCGSPSDRGNADRGAKLFQSRELSSASANLFTCATCHDATPADDSSTAVRPGAVLAGATLRLSFWGGMESDLLAAVNDCRRAFMSDRNALGRDDPSAADLYAFLVGLEPGEPTPVPFTVVSSIVDVARGNADTGQQVVADACGTCHGAPHTGAGRLASTIPILPDDVLTSHAAYDVASQRLIFIEKIRHGGFFGYYGVMPPFSEEVLGDAALGDLLEALGVTGVADSP